MTASTIPQATHGTAVTWAGHDIGYMKTISYSGLTMATKDVTTHDDDFDAIVAGRVNPGEVTLGIEFIPGDLTGQKYLWADIKARTERQVVITLPDTTTWTFNALCTKFGDFQMNDDGSLEASIVLAVNGEPDQSGFDA